MGDGRMRRAAVVLTAAALVLAGCAGEPDAGTATAAAEPGLVGVVTGIGGAPVVGALVTVADRESGEVVRVETDADGRYAVPLSAATYDVLVTDADSIDLREPGADHGGNLFVGPVTVAGAEQLDLTLPATEAAASDDPDRSGGRVGVTVLSDGAPVAGSVRLVPVTAVSREQDVATVPDEVSADLDTDGSASVDFATDQILGIDVEVRDADGELVETVPIDKPEGDLSVQLDVGVSDVVNAEGIAGPLAASDAPRERILRADDEEYDRGAYLPLRTVRLTDRFDEGHVGDPQEWEFSGTPLYVDQTLTLRDAAWPADALENPSGDAEESAQAMFLDTYAGAAPWVRLETSPVYRWQKWQVSVHAPGPMDYTFFDESGDSYALGISFKPFLTTHTVAFDSKAPGIVRIVARLPY